jgi:hypothetical protein
MRSGDITKRPRDTDGRFENRFVTHEWVFPLTPGFASRDGANSLPVAEISRVLEIFWIFFLAPL